MGEHTGRKLREKIYELVVEHWPIHASDVCRKLDIDTSLSNISKVKYHLDRLAEENRIHTKKIDRAKVAWPLEVEKLRVVHEFIREI